MCCQHASTYMATASHDALEAMISLPDDRRLCPLQTHRRRYLFNHVHHWMGRIAIVLTIVAIYLGLRLSNVGAPCGHLECCMSGS